MAACCSHHVFCRLACGSCAAVVIERLAAAGVSGHASLACLCSCLVRRERMREGGGGRLVTLSGLRAPASQAVACQIWDVSASVPAPAFFFRVGAPVVALLALLQALIYF